VLRDCLRWGLVSFSHPQLPKLSIRSHLGEQLERGLVVRTSLFVLDVRPLVAHVAQVDRLHKSLADPFEEPAFVVVVVEESTLEQCNPEYLAD